MFRKIVVLLLFAALSTSFLISIKTADSDDTNAPLFARFLKKGDEVKAYMRKLLSTSATKELRF